MKLIATVGAAAVLLQGSAARADQEAQLIAAYKQAQENVGLVRCLDKSASYVSAFVIPGQLVVTASHFKDLCGNTWNAGLWLNGRIYSIARVVVDEETMDVAVLEVREPLPRGLTLAKSTDFRRGTAVAAFGFPFGLGANPSGTVGHLSGSLVEPYKGKDVARWSIDASINVGNSGGPVVALRTGQVVSLVHGTFAPENVPIVAVFKKDLATAGVSRPMIDRFYDVLEQVTQIGIGFGVTGGDMLSVIDKARKAKAKK